MGAGRSFIVPLTQAGNFAEKQIGGKARTLGRLIAAGYRVPDGFCIDVRAYERFIESTGLSVKIQMELARKPLSTMRWEEIWDAALRIRTAFLAIPIPEDVAEHIRKAYRKIAVSSVVVRSSAPGEDAAERSHAGLHESLVGVRGEQNLLDAVRVVWASLWSDAALLYRRELNMDVSRSRMAVVVQEFVMAELSGVGFGIDPRFPDLDREIVEAVPGRCEGLVSGSVDPDRWIMKRSTGEIVEWNPGARGNKEATPILSREDLGLLHQTLRSVEELLGSPPDVEWTGRSANLTLLQARPVTGIIEKDDDERSWYLSLRPDDRRLGALCERVTKTLIPELEAEVSRFAADELETLSDAALADAIENRLNSLEKWRVIYREEFIPFAHGVRRLGLYYNDAIRPDDPYEFVGLLKDQPMLASERNTALSQLGSLLRNDPSLKEVLSDLVETKKIRSRFAWQQQTRSPAKSSEFDRFCEEFETFLDRHMDMIFNNESLNDRPDLVLGIILELADDREREKKSNGLSSTLLEQRLFDAVGPDRRQEALEVLRIARLSWKFRDDDNILMGRLENQLHRALKLAADRLVHAGRLDIFTGVTREASRILIEALREPSGGKITLPQTPRKSPRSSPLPPGESPRQLIGQPAAPGWATGHVCIVSGTDDFARFRRGNVMVCDAIQPTMTHLVPLACGIVERRGGMLIHGAIIARELGVPCVNGISEATSLLNDGDLVTVDGYLGIVTVGPPEFDLERGAQG